MNPSIVLGFQVHHPLRFTEEEDFKSNAKAFDHMVHRAYVPFIELLLEAIRDNPSFRAFISLSGEHLHQIRTHKKTGHELEDYWNKLLSTGKIQTITEPFVPSIGIWKSERNLFDQILKHHLYLRENFKVHNRTLRLFKHYKWEKTAHIAGLMGFQNILLEGKYTEFGRIPAAPLEPEDQLIIQEHAPMDYKHHLHINHERPKALVFNKSLSKIFWERFDAGDIGQDVAKEFMHRLTSSRFEAFMLDIEEFGTHPRAQEALVFLYELIDTLTKEGVTFYQPEEWLAIAPEQELNRESLRQPENHIHPPQPTGDHLLETAYKELIQTLDMLDATTPKHLAWHYLAHDTQQTNHYFNEHKDVKEETDQYPHFEDFLKNIQFIQKALEKMS